MQSDPSIPQEPQPAPPVAETKPAPRKINFLTIFLGIAVVFLCLALAGLGYWAFTLNTNLQATQADLSELQGKYDSLTTEKNKLSNDFDQTSTELEAVKDELENTKGDLSTAQSDLADSKDAAAALRTKMDKASQYVAIMDNDAAGAIQKMSDVDDSKLESLFLDYVNTRDSTKLQAWMAYIFNTVFDLLK